MRFTFQLRFRTHPGQSLFLTGNHEILGGGRFESALPLRYLDPETWEVSLVLPRSAAPDLDISYRYVLREADCSLEYDWGDDRVFNPFAFPQEEILILDAWNNPGFVENAFYTEPFKHILLKANHTEVPVAAPARTTHLFKAKAPLLEKGQTLCLLGNTPALRNWNTAEPVLLARSETEDFFTAAVDLSGAAFPVEYKFGVYDVARGHFVRYEEGGNRTLLDHVASGKITIVNGGFARLPATTWKGAGVAIPVFSLRTESSLGVGEFSDLKVLADWCCLAGLKLIQLLPVNDTTATHAWTDSYPYAAISAFALHPLYLNLERVAGGNHATLLQGLDAERRRLNELEALDYEAVMNAKLGWARKLFSALKGRTFKTAGFRDFFQQNQDWLVPYAVFCYLRDQYGTPDFNQWPAHRSCRPEALAALADESSAAYEEIAFHYFIQYHLHVQLREAVDYAHAHGIVLKGDVPIGVGRHGADAWQYPELLHMDVQAGAPPDAFAAKGQNWGFPTYNWPRMQQDGFAWWKRRFEQMGCYFDAFRIDHILGFFRIWSIPLDAVQGILGYFVPALPVTAEEFAARGIGLDRERYARPFINDAVLREVFGGDADQVKEQFLDADQNGNYSLKPEFATQRQVERHFASRPGQDRIKEGLYDLISDVLLLEPEGTEEGQFHVRFAIDQTASFRHLDPATQGRLRELYIDYFFRRQDQFWKREAMKKLPALKHVTNLLVCGEDLGLVPACVPDVMRQLGLLSLEIQRMPKDPGRQFFHPKDAPYLSVVTPSTHDMSTVRGWWEEDPALTQRFYNQELGHAGTAPPTCDPGLSREIVLQHLASPAMWSIFQLQDLLGTDPGLHHPKPAEERINIPANPGHYWRYRLHLPLEQLLRAEPFNTALREAIHDSGR